MIDFNNLPAKDKIYYQDDAVIVYFICGMIEVWKRYVANVAALDITARDFARIAICGNIRKFTGSIKVLIKIFAFVGVDNTVLEEKINGCLIITGGTDYVCAVVGLLSTHSIDMHEDTNPKHFINLLCHQKHAKRCRMLVRVKSLLLNTDYIFPEVAGRAMPRYSNGTTLFVDGRVIKNGVSRFSRGIITLVSYAAREIRYLRQTTLFLLAFDQTLFSQYQTGGLYV